MDTAKLQALRAWREHQRETLELPSGLGVTVKRTKLLDLIGNGAIPNTLIGLVQELDKGKDGMRPEDIPALLPLLNAVALGVVAEPPIVAGAGDDEHLGVDELLYEDKLKIFEWANRGVRDVKKFRGEPDGAVGGVPGGLDVRDEAERAAGDGG